MNKPTSQPGAGRVRPTALIILLFVAGWTAVLPARADNRDPRPFDFADETYLTNGIVPDRILMRVNGMDGVSVFDQAPDRFHRGVRVIETTGGFDASGNLLYYNILGMIMPDAFADNEDGMRARAIANHYRAFIFPKRSGDPLSPALPNRRQDNVFDTRDGYFSNNPLGLWVLVFVSYTDEALYSLKGMSALRRIAERNGVDLDGTPILRTADEIDGLAQAGLVQLRTRRLDGSQGFPWVI